MPKADAIAILMQKAVLAGDVAGAVVALGDRHGTVFEAGFGDRRIGTADRMTPDTVCWIASMTKAVVAAGAMRLVEQGRLSLDRPAAEVLPALGDVPVLEGFGSDGAPRLRPARRPMTLRHLLTHTSGFGYDTWSADVMRYMKIKGLPRVGTCRNAALAIPLLFDPGAEWRYGIGIDWAGKIIEALTGQRLGEYLQEALFGPLGMADTGFRLRPDMRARLAPVHHRAADGSLAPGDFAMPDDPEFEMGGGGLYSTARDYLAFARMILNGGRHGQERILQATTVAEMARDQIAPLSAQPLLSVAPAASNDAEFFPGQDCGWGLSFLVNRHPSPQGRSAGGLAWVGLANTYYWIDHGRGTAGVFLTQILPFFAPQAVRLFRGFEAAVNGA